MPSNGNHKPVRSRKSILVVQISMCVAVCFVADAFGQEETLKSLSRKAFLRGHAHNDYYHKRPLLDALDQGFCSVEADVFLQKGELFVAHTFLEIRKKRTLEKLYLTPLFERVQSNGRAVHRKGDRFTLLIDFKSAAENSLEKLNELLKPYSESLTRLEKGRIIQGPVTVVISGNRPIRSIVEAKDRLVFLDGRLKDPQSWGKEYHR